MKIKDAASPVIVFLQQLVVLLSELNEYSSVDPLGAAQLEI